MNAAGLAPTAAGLRYDWVGDLGPDDVGEVPGIVRSWIPDGVRVLDVGCATGAATVKFTGGKDCSVVGVEPDAARAAAARARGLDVKTGLLDEGLLKRQGPFDVIIFGDVLEHVAAPAALLDLAKTGLADGGTIIASVPNVAHWTVRVKLLLGRFDYAQTGIMDATHLRWFTEKSIRRLFEHSGMQVLDVSPSAGAWMGEYRRPPFKFIPTSLRAKLVRGLARAMPRLFGCQLVVRARPGERPERRGPA